MDISNSSLGLLPYYFMGGLVVVLLLLLVSFILNNRRTSRIEALMEDLQERLVQSEIALADADKSLDELFGKRRTDGGELKIPTDLESITFMDDSGNSHNLKETIDSLKQQINDVGAEQHRYYESIIQEQQVLVESVSSLKDLIANIQADRANNNVSAPESTEFTPNNNQFPTYHDPQEDSFLEAEQAFNNGSNGIFMPPGAQRAMASNMPPASDDLGSDASFAQTAADIAQLVAKTDFSAIDPNTAPTTIGEHIQNAQRNQQVNRNPRATSGHNQKTHQNHAPQNFGAGRDPMNPLGMDSKFAHNNSFEPASTFGSQSPDLGAMGTKENPTPGLLPEGAEEYIEFEIESPNTKDSSKGLQSVSIEPNYNDQFTDSSLNQPESEDLLSLDNKDELSGLEAIDFNEVVIPKNIDKSQATKESLDTKPHDVALGMDDQDHAEQMAKDGWQVAQVSPRAAFADQEISGAIQDRGNQPHAKELHHNAHDQVAHSDDDRFDALESFSRLYNNSLQDEKSDKPNNLLDSSFGSEQSVNQATGNTQLTIDYTSSDSLDNLDNLKVAVNHEMSSGVAKAKKSKSNMQGDMSAANVDYLKVPQNAPVVDMIYDHDYVQQQKDKRPNGISIDTLDKAKTFIEAGVSLTEISAKTGLSEDEIKLIYDVDENGKIKDTSAQFKKQALEQELLESQAHEQEKNDDNPLSAVAKEEKVSLEVSEVKDSSLGSENTKNSKRTTKTKNAKAKGNKKSKNNDQRKLSALEDNNPSSALDKDERMVIESMMQEKHDPFSIEVAKEVEDSDNNIDPIPAPVSEELSEEEALAASLLSREALENGQLPELSQEADFKAAVEQNKLEREQALSSSIEEEEASVALETNLDAIDELANSIISENEKSGLLSTKEHSTSLSESFNSEIDDPLNVLGDFKHKKGASVAALAQSIKNTSDEYMAELKHDIDDALKDDSVTIGNNNSRSKASIKKNTPNKDNMSVEQKVKANRQKISSLSSSKDAPSHAAKAAMSAQKAHNARKNKARDQGAIGAVGSATSHSAYDNHYEGLGSATFKANVSNNNGMKASLEKGPQSSGRGLSALLGTNIDDDITLERTRASRANDMPIKSNSYPTVDEALAQIESVPRSAPLSLGAIEQRSNRSTSGFSSVSAKNPGMADVIAMAPMALGSIEGADGSMMLDGNMEDEDPAAILSQVVKGGLNSVATLSPDQLNTLNEIQSGRLQAEAMPSANKQHYANYQARNAYGIKRR